VATHVYDTTTGGRPSVRYAPDGLSCIGLLRAGKLSQSIRAKSPRTERTCQVADKLISSLLFCAPLQCD